ncbi:MAG: hypothetical protein AB4062_05135 [Crocosphaera sp.]
MMLRKSKPLIKGTVHQITRFPGWLCCLMLTLGSASGSWGQTTSNRPLPPPPSPKMVTPQSAPPSQTLPISVEVSPPEESSAPIKEYTFSAPQTGTVSPSVPPSNPIQTETVSPSVPQSQPRGNPRFYRVEVKGNEASLLSQVKAVEPMAFIRESEGVIHAGMFQGSQQAEKRVQELQRQGVSAQVVPVYQRTNNALSVELQR